MQKVLVPFLIATFSMAAVPTEADLNKAVAMRAPVVAAVKKLHGAVLQLQKSVRPGSLLRQDAAVIPNSVLWRFVGLNNDLSCEHRLMALEIQAAKVADLGPKVTALREYMDQGILSTAMALQKDVEFYQKDPGLDPEIRASLGEVAQSCKDIGVRITGLLGPGAARGGETKAQ